MPNGGLGVAAAIADLAEHQGHVDRFVTARSV
jgi:hypothetical protein